MVLLGTLNPVGVYHPPAPAGFFILTKLSQVLRSISPTLAAATVRVVTPRR